MKVHGDRKAGRQLISQPRTEAPSCSRNLARARARALMTASLAFARASLSLCPGPRSSASPPPPLGPSVESGGGQHLEGRWSGAEQQLEGRCRGSWLEQRGLGLGVGPECAAASQLVGGPGRDSAWSRDRGRVGVLGGPKFREAPGWVETRGGGVASSKCSPESLCFPLPWDKYL